MPAHDGALFVALGQAMESIERRGTRRARLVAFDEHPEARTIAGVEKRQELTLRSPGGVEFQGLHVAYRLREGLAVATLVGPPCGFQSRGSLDGGRRRIEPVQDASSVVAEPPPQHDKQA